jgi:sugar phosphate isomerase/epimerase
MKISILSYSFRGMLASGEMSIFGYLEACRYRYGLGAADLWSGHFTSTEPAFIAQVKNALEERDLKLADIAVDGAHVWEPEAEAREKNYERAKLFLGIGATLGAKVVRIDAGSRNESWTTEEFDFIVKRYQEYCKFAADNGFIVAIENHWGPERVWTNLKAVLDAVDRPNFGVSNHFGGWPGTDEDKIAGDRLVAPYVVHTHIPINICTNPAVLKEKLSNLWNLGYSHYYSVEHHSAKDEYFETGVQLALVRDMLDRMRRGVA